MFNVSRSLIGASKQVEAITILWHWLFCIGRSNSCYFCNISFGGDVLEEWNAVVMSLPTVLLLRGLADCRSTIITGVTDVIPLRAFVNVVVVSVGKITTGHLF